MALPKQRTTETTSVSGSPRHSSEIRNRVDRSEEQVIVEKNGVPVAATVPMSLAEQTEGKERHRAGLLQAFDAQRDVAGVDDEEAEREFAAALQEFRRERNRARRIGSAMARAAPDVVSGSDDDRTAAATSMLKPEEAQTILERFRGAGAMS